MKAKVVELGVWSGGTVLDLASVGSRALAATLAGLYLSTDGGHTWRRVGRDLPDWFVQAVAIARSDDGAVALAASRNGWLYRSSDGGATWEVVDGWDPAYGVISCLLPSPDFARDGVVFAGTEEDGVFKSRDRGHTWRHASFGLLNLSVTALACSPGFGHDEVAFAGTELGGLFRSRNAGRAWRESGEGLPDSAVQCIAVSPDSDGVVFAGTEDRGLFRSTDGGRTWLPVGGMPDGVGINDIYVGPGWASGGMLLAATDVGMLFSRDGGETWQGVEGGPEYPYGIVRLDDRWLVGAYEDGICVSLDGVAWQESNSGLAAHVPPLACFGADSRRLWLASMEGVMVRSTDGGRTWDRVEVGDVDEITSLVGVPLGDDLALIALSGSALLRSTDGGVSWKKVLEVDAPLSTLSATGEVALSGSVGGGVWTSRDGGASWAEVTLFDGMVIAAARDDAIYAVTASPGGDGMWQLSLWRDGDEEVLWTAVAGQPVAHLLPLDGGRLFCTLGGRMAVLKGREVVIESELEGGVPVSSVARVGERLLVGARPGLFVSDDGGRSWARLAGDLPAVAIHVASATRVYVVTVGGRLWEVRI